MHPGPTRFAFRVDGLRHLGEGTAPVAGLVYMLGAAVCFSIMGVGAKVLGETLPVSQIIVVRGLITMGLSAAVLQLRGRSFRGSRYGLLLLRGLCGFGGLTCFFHAVQHLPLADATVLFYTNPIFTALGAAFFLSEALRARDAVGLVLAFAGVVFVARPDFLFGASSGGSSEAGTGDGASFGVLLALGGALFSAGSYITIRKLRASDDPWVITLYFTFVAVPLALPQAWLHGRWPSGEEWAWLALVGLSTQAGQVLGAYGLHRLPAGPAVALGYAQVLLSFGWGLLFFQEPLQLWSLFGAGLVFAGVLVIGAGIRQRARTAGTATAPNPGRGGKPEAAKP